MIDSKTRRTWRSILERFTNQLELPPDAFLDLPRIVVVGSGSLQIANHKGILEYTPYKIRVGTAQGQVIVTGTRLKIESIFQQEVAIDGRISNIQLTK